MNYPRIYSLSTVGILKHYVHDYLFHSLRTDFIGANGIGKSIVADLFQLLFIYDTDIIQFGTEGLNQNKRSIYTLPYKSNVAYCLLNIEVAKGQFLTIGIMISSHIGARIIPFVVTSQSQLNSPIETLALGKEKIILANDLLIDQAIPDLESISKKLFKASNLYLTPFKNKEQVSQYYKFLYDKNILPINLSNENGFKAFSKVIQSFSKAKSLNLSPSSASKSLQEFLFEESDSELVEKYTTQQKDLDKLLKEYKRLNNDIETLELKQEYLIKLKTSQEAQQINYKKYKQAELIEQKEIIDSLHNTELDLKNELTQKKDEKIKLERIVSRFPEVKLKLEAAAKVAQDNYDLHSEFSNLFTTIENIEQEIIKLQKLQLPELNGWEALQVKIDMSLRNTIEIETLISFVSDLAKKYRSPQELEEKRRVQEQKIRDLIQSSITNREQKEKLLQIIKGSGTDSLANFIFKAGKDLSEPEQNVLLHLALTPTLKPRNPKINDRYLDSEIFFENIQVEADTNIAGYWIKFGPLSEFAAAHPYASLFQPSKKGKNSLQDFCTRLERDIQTEDKKLKELEKISNGKVYDKKIIEQDFDLAIIEYSNIEKFQDGVTVIFNLDTKLEQLTLAKEKAQKRKTELQLLLPSNIYSEDPVTLKRELSKIRNRCNNRVVTYSSSFSKTEVTLRHLTGDIEKISSTLREAQQKILEQQGAFSKLYSSYFNEFNENVSDFPALEDSVQNISKKHQESKEFYVQTYYETIGQFEETKNNKSPEVSTEVSSKNYSFEVLERVLLGTKIKSSDKIAVALRDANQSRLNIADSIKDGMVKVFDATHKRFKEYKDQIQSINTFFKGRKISDRFYFKIEFKENSTIKIEFLEEMGAKMRDAAKQGELAFDRPVGDFIEEFYRKLARITSRIPIDKLLSPKTYFDLHVGLTDENNVEIPGSSGETYSAIALLGIARLSFAQAESRKGLRFIILEEIGSLDASNFNTFPEIAKEFNYQIITMAPQPFRTALSDEWYAHHLIKGKDDKNINFYPSASYFKTPNSSEDLKIYLNKINNELA